MSDHQDDASQSQSQSQSQLTAPDWRDRALQWIKREGRFVADTIHPDSANLGKGRRLASWAILRVKGLILLVVGAVAAVIVTHYTAEDSARTGGKAEGAINAENGYIHATIRLKPYESYDPPYETFSESKLTLRQIRGINSGEYTAEEAVKGGMAAQWSGVAPGLGQVYFADLVSDSSSMIIVTDIRPVNISCRNSKMVTQISTSGEGGVAISDLAYVLQGDHEAGNGFIMDDSNRGDPYFDHYSITLGGGADAQTLKILGVAKPGSRCTWDLRAGFTTDDGQSHQAKINGKPLVTEGGPSEESGAQHLRVYAHRLIEWECAHGQRKQEDCPKPS